MAEELLLVSCRLPVMSDGRPATKDEAMPVLRTRIAALDEDELDELSWAMAGESLDPAEVRERLEEFAALHLFADRNRVLTSYQVNGRWVVETGGLSLGGDPTDEYGPIQALGESGITDLPINGGVFVPPPLRRAVEALGTAAGFEVTEELITVAVRAFDLTGAQQ